MHKELTEGALQSSKKEISKIPWARALQSPLQRGFVKHPRKGLHEAHRYFTWEGFAKLQYRGWVLYGSCDQVYILTQQIWQEGQYKSECCRERAVLVHRGFVKHQRKELHEAPNCFTQERALPCSWGLYEALIQKVGLTWLI